MPYHTISLLVLTCVFSWACATAGSASIPIENASFEAQALVGDVNMPTLDPWIVDPCAGMGTGTGVFLNPPQGDPNHIVNADGSQLARLGSGQGNALAQELAFPYQVGHDYRLTVAIGSSPIEPQGNDVIELVLYYVDGAKGVDVAWQVVEATGLSSTQLKDFSVCLPAVRPDDPWAGKQIGVAIRAAGTPGGFWDLDHVHLTESLPVAVAVENASFEGPVVDSNGFPALPFMDGWTEIDVDTQFSTNTGVFANTPQGSPDRLVNAHGNQMAFLGSETGNALEQDLAATYHMGCTYRLTAAVGVSARFPPVGSVELVLYYRDAAKRMDVAVHTVQALGLSSTELKDFSVENDHYG